MHFQMERDHDVQHVIRDPRRAENWGLDPTIVMPTMVQVHLFRSFHLMEHFSSSAGIDH